MYRNKMPEHTIELLLAERLVYNELKAVNRVKDDEYKVFAKSVAVTFGIASFILWCAFVLVCGWDFAVIVLIYMGFCVGGTYIASLRFEQFISRMLTHNFNVVNKKVQAAFRHAAVKKVD